MSDLLATISKASGEKSALRQKMYRKRMMQTHTTDNQRVKLGEQDGH